MNDKPTYEQLEKRIAELEYELESSKKYGLVWDKEHVKEEVVKKCEQHIPVLIQDETKRVNSLANENNILIEGDNYHSLTAMNFVLKETIDIIYIDPPYNTGNNDYTGDIERCGPVFLIIKHMTEVKPFKERAQRPAHIRVI